MSIKCVNIASSILALTTMEKLRDKNVLIEVQGKSYWLDKEAYDKMKEWVKKRELEFPKRWLTLTKNNQFK